MKAVAGVALIHAVLLYGLLYGLSPDFRVAVSDGLKTFDVPPSVPPSPVAEEVAADRAPDPEGAAAPPNLKARPTEIVTPKPKIVLPPKPPVAAAPMAGRGNAPSAGAAPVPGPGTGRGGVGTGLGAGRGGYGTGGGRGYASRARLISGDITRRDFPRRKRWPQSQMVVMIDIGSDGRVAGCRVQRSSGDAEVDGITCDVIIRRFRYDPARDRRGKPTTDAMRWTQTWWLE